MTKRESLQFPHVDIYVSCRNERDSIVTLLSEIKQVISNTEYNFRVTVVDNASTDDSMIQISSAFNNEINLISLERNLGYSGSIHEAIRNSSGDVIIVLDGDGQFSPSDIPHICEEILNKGKDLVLCMREQLIGNRIRKLGSKTLVILCFLILNFRNKDINAGIRGFSSKFAYELKIHQLPLPYRSLVNPLLYAVSSSWNLEIGYISINTRSRISGESFLAWDKPFQLFRQGLRELLEIKRLSKEVKN